MADVSFLFAGAALVPLPCGALWWPSEMALIAADLHLEKGSSLARDGWFLPPYDSRDTLARLSASVTRTDARHLILLGDSFHDAGGPARLDACAADLLAGIRAHARITWIAGNHDGLSPGALPGATADYLMLGGILLHHDIDPADPRPQMAGHFHPKVAVPVRAGRSARRRCYALTATRLVLPAYGAYAGGLDVWSPVLARAMGATPQALLATSAGLLRVNRPAGVGAGVTRSSQRMSA